MIKSVIFDLDGVLVSTDELHYNAWKKLADELGITEFTKEDNEKQRGVSRMESLEVVLSKGNKEYSEEEKIALADRKNNYYIEMLESIDESVILGGATETLKMLRERGIKVGVGSASKNTPMILAKTGLEKYIDKVSCGLDTTKSKPDPEVFVIAAQKLETPHEECLVVEDSAAGIVAAKAAGMKSLGVGPYYETLKADYEARTLKAVDDWNIVLDV
ncbi:MAG: beta-phosphoglucomutase [Lachnospiraceae bacterium]|nr:beta-phosphoglucomutase [Lachnospiraceae bacterium]